MAADLRDLLTPSSDPHAPQQHHQQQYPPANGHGYGHPSGGESRSGGGGGGGGRGGADNCQLYLGVPQLTEQDIRSLLSHHGSIRSISCKPEFSFVEMETPEQAKAVIAEFDRKTVDLKDANGSVIRTIQEFKCEFSRPRRERGPRGPSSRYDDAGAGGGHGGGGGAGGKTTTCYVCNKEGHWARDCPQSTRSSNVCYNCNQPGHRARDCPQPRSESRRGPPPSRDRHDDRRDYRDRDRDRDYRDTHTHRDNYPPRDTRYDEYPPRDTRYGGAASGYPPAPAAAAAAAAYPPLRDYDRGYRRSRSRSPPPRGYDDRYHRRSPSPVRGYPPAAPAPYAPPPSSRYDSRGAPPAPYAPPAASAYAPPPVASSVPYYRDAAPPAAAAPYDPYAKYDRRDPYAPAPVAAPAAYAPPTASTYGSYSAPPPVSSYPPRGASGSSSNGSRRY